MMDARTTRTARPTWKELLAREKPLLLPVAHDALAARLIERAGFAAYSIGGFPLVGARYGIPDIGLVVGVDQNRQRRGCHDVAHADTHLAEADEGYGDVKNVA